MSSKYTEEELREMARTVLQAEADGDVRVLHLLLVLSDVTRLSPDECMNRIKELAE